jgi:hypothetical protein
MTKNSPYEVEVLEEKPYGLRGGDLAKTQEMVFPIEIGDGDGKDGLNSLHKREREVFQLLAEIFSKTSTGLASLPSSFISVQVARTRMLFRTTKSEF